MSDVPSQLAALIVLGFLVAIFVTVQRQNRSAPVGLWILAWGLVFLRSLLHVLEPSFQEELLQFVDLGALELAGVVFLTSVSDLAEHPRPRLVLWLLLGGPALLYSFAALRGMSLPWLYLGTVATMVYGSILFVLFFYRKLTISVMSLLGVLAVAGPGMIYEVLRGDVAAVLQIIPASFFALAGVFFWRRYRRLSPGVLTAFAAFMAWAASVALPLLMRLEPATPLRRQPVWDAPIFLVAVGMIVTLLEDQSNQQRALEAQLRSANLELRELSLNDALTKVHNRRYFYLNIERDVTKAIRAFSDAAGGSTAQTHYMNFLIVDIDHFKAVNDTYGHAVGDEVLVEVATRLGSVLRRSDMLIRWGGEEFLIVSTHSDQSGIENLFRKLLDAVGSKPFKFDHTSLHVTCSIGWAPFPWWRKSPSQVSCEEVLQLADKALYVAKESGRNMAVGFLEAPEARLAGIEAVPSDLYGGDGLAVHKIITRGPQVHQPSTSGNGSSSPSRPLQSQPVEAPAAIDPQSSARLKVY